ncbi:hybrid sensor histidine kinase/response regulator [Pseudomonas guariconensis]|uniref:ATP-binding response regulator n=1 Tax=Pseudomonas TaxID=286 RepID=UPI002097EBD5|nr:MULTISPECIES: hybrid sensor histidine kinase/response regulator [Pseudomonas]MCO7515979.1 hybrid sensor histidine kinase/response regulator [Pseudomonas putida]MCO7606422.1 hybrid sensor histidine kinase/response regulator [Pseudomonas guariconensis]
MTRLRELQVAAVELFGLPQRFSSARDEQGFLDTQAIENLRRRRLFMFVAIAVWAGFGYWDYYHYISHEHVLSRTDFHGILVWRVVGTLAIAAVTVVSFTARFEDERWVNRSVVVTVCFTQTCLVAMVQIVPAPLNYNYYFVGIVLVIFFQHGTLALLARYSLFSTGYCVLLFLLQEIATGALQINFFPAMFYLLAFTLVGWTISVRAEKVAREGYLKTLALNRKNESLEQANSRIRREKQKADDALKALFDQEARKAAQIREKAEASTRFVRAAYHDTMQPLASIASLAFAGERIVEQGQHDRLREVFRDIEASGREISALFTGLREVFTSGESQPAIEPFSLNELMTELECLYMPSAQAKGLRLRLPQRRRDAVLNSDRAIFKRILGNLISNAIKYTERGGVLVGSVAGRTTLRIDVVDTGIGIPDAFKRKIFEEFFQVDNPNHDSQRGLGLGLSIVKNFIDRLPGHRLTFASRPGHGSRFSIDCPLYQGDEPPLGASAPAVQVNGKDLDITGAYVLLVDDDKRILDSLSKSLTLQGAIVVTAEDRASLQAALERAPDRYPDLLICDYTLHDGLVGVALIEHVRAFYDWAQVPAILYSAELLPRPLDDDFLSRSVSKGESAATLMAAVQQLLFRGRQANAGEAGEDSTPST